MYERLQEKKDQYWYKAAVMGYIGLAALTGCSGGGENASATHPPTEQTQVPAETEAATPETTATTEATSEAPAELEVSKIDLADSAIYNKMSAADKKSVDRYMKLSLEEFRNLDETEQNLLGTVLISAGEKMYLNSVKDIEIDQWGPLSSYQESRNSPNRVDFSKINFNAAMYTPADTIRDDGPRDEGGYFPTVFVEDGWISAEVTPYIQENIAVGIASEFAASGIPENLDAAKKIIVSSIYTNRDVYSSGRMFDIEDELLTRLDSIAASGTYDDLFRNWPRTDIYGRMLDLMPNTEMLVFDDGSGYAIGPNESGETLAEYAVGARIKMTDGKVAQGWMQSDSYTNADPIAVSGIDISREGGKGADGMTTHGFEISGTDY